MAAYQWKTPGFFKVDAQTAGAELDRIYREHGCIDPETVVNESRNKSAPLHPLFEWDDKVAAERWRENQARVIIANVAIVGEPNDDIYTRAFVHVEDTYQPISVVLESADKTEELLQQAMRELRTFENKYRELSALAPVFTAITEVVD